MRAALAVTLSSAGACGKETDGRIDGGSLEKGKHADLAAVSGDPLKDISELQQIKFMMKGRKVVRNHLK
jgi:imidazolonepropionase-like amidohydrolase